MFSYENSDILSSLHVRHNKILLASSENNFDINQIHVLSGGKAQVLFSLEVDEITLKDLE